MSVPVMGISYDLSKPIYSATDFHNNAIKVRRWLSNEK